MRALFSQTIQRIDDKIKHMTVEEKKLFLVQLLIGMCRTADHLRHNVGDLAMMVLDYPYEFNQDQNIYSKKGEN